MTDVQQDQTEYRELPGGSPYIYRYGGVPHIGHHYHLCDLAENGEITLEQMKALVKDPKFICKKCGRVANREENLCEPVPL
jgi:hypothetical protein